jgi:polyisoprenoid-binding protein YceI
MPLSYRGMAEASKVVCSVTRGVVLLAGVAVLVAACSRATSPDRGGTRPVLTEGAPAAAVGSSSNERGSNAHGAKDYAVIVDESLLTLRVFRAGALARLGHNHVIASRHLQGRLRFGGSLSDASLALTVPVTLLSIDEPALRAQAGADFETDVPDSARSGTRDNLLGPALLDGSRFPGVQIESESLTGSVPGRVMATLQIRVRDVQTRLELPVNVEQPDAQTLLVSGAASLRQSQFGLVPFSVMMGALQVQDEMRLQFRIVARRTINN